MSETQVSEGAAVAADVVDAVAGGTSTVNVSGPGVSVEATGPNPSAALISVYEGFVDVTSHIIERIGNALQ